MLREETLPFMFGNPGIVAIYTHNDATPSRNPPPTAFDDFRIAAL